MKVIQILHHSMSPYKMGVDVRFYEEDWHVKVAKEIIKRTDKYDVECWRPETTFKKIYTREKDGIFYKIFPSLYLNFPREYSLSMFRALKKQCKDEDILIHLHGIHNHLAHLIAYLFRDLPIVGANLGGSFYRTRYRNAKKIYLKLFGFPHYLLEPSILRCMDHIMVGTKFQLKTVSKFHPRVEIFPNDGVDFEEIDRLPDKYEARQLLNLPQDKKIMLYVGRFFKLKGVHHIIHTYQELNKKIDVELVLIGGNKFEPLYNEAVNSGAIVIERVPHDALMPYYKAADVNLMLPFGEPIYCYGIGTAQRESICCGTPVVSPNLIDTVGTEEEIKQYGEVPNSTEDVEECILKILNDPAPYKNCSKIMKKYISWDAVIRHHINIYDELFEKYYGRC